jgi:hypothetical protein
MCCTTSSMQARLLLYRIISCFCAAAHLCCMMHPPARQQGGVCAQVQAALPALEARWCAQHSIARVVVTADEPPVLCWCPVRSQPTTRVPLPAQWDAPTILAFLDCLRSVQLSFVTVAADNLDDGSSSSYLTIPPVTAALVVGLLLVFTRPGGVALRDVALSPYCVLQRKEYWRWGAGHTHTEGGGVLGAWEPRGCGNAAGGVWAVCSTGPGPAAGALDRSPAVVRLCFFGGVGV